MEHPTPSIKIRIKSAFESGTSISQLSKIFGYHRNSISRWIENSNEDPKFLTLRKSGSGRPSKLAGQYGKKILQMIKKPASEYGFETDFWTTGRLQTVCKVNLKFNGTELTHSISYDFIPYNRSAGVKARK